MSIQIKMDRPALLAMIEKDDEFRFELSNAVVSEVIRKVFEKDMGRLMKEAEPELFKRAVAALQDNMDMTARLRRALEQQMVTRTSWGNMPAMSPALKEVFDKSVLTAKAQLEAAVDTAMQKFVSERAAALVEQKLADVDLDARIANRVDRLINEEIKRRVEEQMAAKLAAMNAALKG